MGDSMLRFADKAERDEIDAGKILLNNEMLSGYEILQLISDYKAENGITDDDIEGDPYAFNSEKFQEYIKNHLEKEITRNKLLKEASDIVNAVKESHKSELEEVKATPVERRSKLLRIRSRDDGEKEPTNSKNNPVKWASEDEIKEMVEEFKKLHKQQEDLMTQCIVGENLADSTFGWNIDLYLATEKVKRLLVDKILSEKYHQPRNAYMRQHFMEEYIREYNNVAVKEM